ncbi:hypothetical protein [Carboxylicivirga sp. N1Y90]|uniref:hypothetical protein n=1 Tax=Carboxylicivirga fragile TaxID=3417571 RepID=UPI003D330270|nr:hypothetical protein [Marinilabiliaceae bacterium N1Y90]
MNQRSAIETHYLKLLGVTLVFSAACIGNSSQKDNSSFAINEVREIILDQIQHLGVSNYSDVIDWELALGDVPSVDVNCQSFGLTTSVIDVVQVSNAKIKQLYSLLEEPIHLHHSLKENASGIQFNSVCYLDSYSSLSNPSRAGPSACFI